MGFEKTIATTSIIDHHAHSVEPLSESTVTEAFATYFTEGDLSQENAANTLYYQGGLDLLAERFDGNSETELLAQRARVNLPEYSKELINETNTEVILVDEGFPDVTPDEFREYTNTDVRPILRIESVIEKLIGVCESFDELETAYEEKVRSALAGEYVALKSIVAYRTGLDVSDPERSKARRAFQSINSREFSRIDNSAIIDYFVHYTCELAVEYDAPFQFHTGFGDSDAHPRYVNPTYLTELVTTHPETSFVFLHAGYPYVRQAGYVTATFENVYLDISLAVPFIWHGCVSMIRALLELTPTSKLLYASDAFSIPEHFLLAERRIRADLLSVLTELVENKYVSESYASTIARNILRENANQLYNLNR